MISLLKNKSNFFKQNDVFIVEDVLIYYFLSFNQLLSTINREKDMILVLIYFFKDFKQSNSLTTLLIVIETIEMLFVTFYFFPRYSDLLDSIIL